MMERKEGVEIDPAQFFQQFNLQADRDMHDLIFDVVEDVARTLDREETEYLKTDYDNLRDSLDSVATLAQKFGLRHLSRVAQDVNSVSMRMILLLCPPHFSSFLALGNSPFSQSGTCQSIHDWHWKFHVSFASVSINHSYGETHG